MQGQFVYGIEGRGGGVRLVYGPTERFADSDCVSCGACVEVCPTGAIGDRDRVPHAPIATEATESVCGYCGVGCRLGIETDQGVILRIGGIGNAAVNRGHLCVKGRYAHAFVARRLLEVRDAHGSDALGTMTSSRSTNEAAYLLQKLFRGIIGTNNVDCCARVCHASTAVALGMVTGTGAATASYDDIERASTLIVAGANPTEAHPVVGARIKQAALAGTPLIVIDPRATELSRYAAVHLQLWPGTNVALFNALTKMIVEEGRYDAAYVAGRCEGFEELRAFLAAQSLDELSAITRVPVERLRMASRIIGTTGSGVSGGGNLFISGLGLSEQTQGVGGVMAYCNLGLLTGAIGFVGSGMLPLRGQNNVQGNADMGSQPYALTGYMKLGDPSVQERLEREWGAAPPTEAGKTIPEMHDAADAANLFIQGTPALKEYDAA